MTFINKNTVSVNKKLIVGVSGGCDSVVLLHALLQQGYTNIVVAHVNHGIRKESGEDAALVEQLCTDSGVAFKLLTVDVVAESELRKKGLEETGREIRYTFFSDLMRSHSADVIVTAHHADDQVETILLNIIRGCGLRGLVGMEEISELLWRPLLKISKRELYRYAKKHKLTFSEDSSNSDLNFNRNLLRHKVIPHLKKINPRFLATFESNRTIWQASYKHHFDSAGCFVIDQCLDERRFDLKEFQNLSTIAQQEVLRKLYQQEHGQLRNLQKSHLDQLQKILNGTVGGKRKEFGTGKMLVRRKQSFEIIDND